METKVYTIGQICKRFSSGKFISADNIAEQGEYPVYGGNGLRGYSSMTNFDGECSIIGRQGAYCGNVRYFNGKGYMTDHAIVAITNKEHCNRFFSYKLSLANLGRFSGQAAQPGLSVTKLARLRLEMPPLPTQRRIASILSTYDSLIENNTRRIRLLEQMAESLYKEWFVRFRFPGHETCKMLDGIPEGWRVERIGNICETIGGGTPSTTTEEFWGGDIKWVTPTDITGKNSLPLINIEGRITEAGLKHSSAKLLPAGTILMTSRASIGFFGISKEAVCTNQGFISIIPNDEKMRMYILYNLQSRKEEIIANANGSTFLEISKGRFRKMKMLLPTDDLLMAFESKCEEIFDAIYTLELSSASLARQRDLLLPRLMSGKIEV